MFRKLRDMLRANSIIMRMNAVRPNSADRRVGEADAVWLVEHLLPEETADRKRRLSRKIMHGETMFSGGRFVCNTCGGNCGQCGDTGLYGNIGFDMRRIARTDDPSRNA